MRLKIFARPMHPVAVIPIQYNVYLQGFVYRLLEEQMPEVHDVGFKTGNLHFRHFTFSRIFSREMQRKGNGLIIKRDMHFFLSLFVENMPQVALNQILLGQQLYIGKEPFEITNIKVFDSPLPKEDCNIQMDFQSLSPIVVCKSFLKDDNRKWTQYYTPFDEEFIPLIKNNLIKKLRSVEPASENAESYNLHIAPINVDPVKGKSVVRYKGIILEGYTGIFRYKGSSRLAEVGYQTGLGAKNPQGFGMIMVRNIQRL